MQKPTGRQKPTGWPIRLVFVTGLAASLAIFPVFSPGQVQFAYADDDDGDDDDDGGGGGGGGGGLSGGGGGPSGGSSVRSGGSDLWPFKKLQKRKAVRKPVARAKSTKRAPVKRAVVPAIYRDRQIVTIGLSAAELDSLVARGYAVNEQRNVVSVGAQMARLSVPRGTSMETARTEIRAINPTGLADFNHYYRPQQDNACVDNACLAWSQLQWPASATASAACGGDVRIGIVDTRVNTKHEAFDGARVETLDTAPADASESGAGHGTAVAALLVGSRLSRTPGLLPAAQVLAVDPFEKSGADERSDVYAIVAAIDLLAERNVHAINLSLSGPDNDLLEKIVSAVSARGIPLIAAAGNNGANSPPLYPAAYGEAIAVTAVDRNGQIYRRAVRGDHIDLAAPGVNVWTAASVKGGKPKTGTSFAAPFVTAAAGVIKAANPDMGAAAIGELLAKSARDLGEPEKDSIFGAGLIQASGLCVAAPEVIPAAAQ